MSRRALRTGPVVPAARRALYRSWISVVLLPVTFAAATVVGDGVLTMLGYPSGSEDTAPIGYALLVGIPAMALAISPGVAAYVFGMRARRGGIGSGIVPAVIGATVALGFLLLNVASLVIVVY